MINPTTEDIGQFVVCKFGNGKIKGEIIALGETVDGKYITVSTRIGEQNFSFEEAEWNDQRRLKESVKPTEPAKTNPPPAAPAA